eukprot:1786083-Amphidinium_carterae.1
MQTFLTKTSVDERIVDYTKMLYQGYKHHSMVEVGPNRSEQARVRDLNPFALGAARDANYLGGCTINLIVVGVYTSLKL